MRLNLGKYDVIGFDIDRERVDELLSGKDRTGEISQAELKSAQRLRVVSNERDIEECNIFIITVPTPIDEYKDPDLKPLISASCLVGKYLKSNDIVIYESTVFPGATEDICAPILSEKSGLFYASSPQTKETNAFFLGYSPERINPGDKEHRITDIIKVTSGSTPEVAEFVDKLYGSIIPVGTHKASSIKIAEAAKVIENTQRDVNIALINELAVLFEKLGLDTEAILKAAGSKWNFLPFRPGLVGGHCIGVDPYYLTHKAHKVGYHPEMILAGRRINDKMSSYLADRVTKLMIDTGIDVLNSKILVLGLTFKENCPDIRNSKVADMVNSLAKKSKNIDVYDPYLSSLPKSINFKGNMIGKLQNIPMIALFLLFLIRYLLRWVQNKSVSLEKEKHVLFDLKYAFDASEADGRL